MFFVCLLVRKFHTPYTKPITVICTPCSFVFAPFFMLSALNFLSSALPALLYVPLLHAFSFLPAQNKLIYRDKKNLKEGFIRNKNW